MIGVSEINNYQYVNLSNVIEGIHINRLEMIVRFDRCLVSVVNIYVANGTYKEYQKLKKKIRFEKFLNLILENRLMYLTEKANRKQKIKSLGG